MSDPAGQGGDELRLACLMESGWNDCSETRPLTRGSGYAVAYSEPPIQGPKGKRGADAGAEGKNNPPRVGRVLRSGATSPAIFHAKLPKALISSRLRGAFNTSRNKTNRRNPQSRSV